VTYAVKEIFLTQQGEGANIGRTAVFIRFAGCNLWSGREQDRATATCRFCDTDFVGGTRYATADDLAEAVLAAWTARQPEHHMVVLTGGEPLLQADEPLIRALRARNFYVAVETNGTQPLPCHIDWICVSPKAGAPLLLMHADELKLVYPQDGLTPDDLSGFHSGHRWLSPMDLPGRRTRNVDAATAYCRDHPEWRLAIQAHKYWNIP